MNDSEFSQLARLLEEASRLRTTITELKKVLESVQSDPQDRKRMIQAVIGTQDNHCSNRVLWKSSTATAFLISDKTAEKIWKLIADEIETNLKAEQEKLDKLH